MDRPKEFVAWLDEHRDWCFDLLRAYLGIGLLVKGVLFASDPNLLPSLMEGGRLQGVPVILTHYVVLAHLGGGLMMAIGLLTRLAALVQMPILIGAVFFVHLQGGLFAQSQNLEFSLLVLLLLVVIAAHGSGRWSADHYLFGSKEKVAPAG